jgi:alpha-ketoglutarate-dependent taurine dioxygenase
MDFISWARQNQQKIAKAIQELGVIVFNGFNLTQEKFSEAFTAITGSAPQVYKGDTPRDEVSYQIYKSTAVGNAHTIPLHQEVSGGSRTDMPKYISFFCVTPPTEGTGQTVVGNARKISRRIQQQMPKFWSDMTTKTLTYKARYLPSNHWRTNWIRWLNPSHATIQKRFGTEKREEVEAICQREGLICEWDGDWAVISRKGVPAIIERDGEKLFCNQVHVDRLNPKLCGGWIQYIFARLFLYPTSRSMQFDVHFDDGSQISRKDASQLLSILEEYQEGRNWKKGDLMVIDNATTLHGKTSHVGKREILVAMTGSV